ncbi:hypothetical protein MNBD_NITROSPINAE02-1938 [hydrothermal vent metagenome]|uniref:Uncharacterized protein n=1 Tax=hydrothermal vent metagenome TaxID=652676 RepID=A0A3B1D2I5_9ZZZZ
MPTIIDRRIRSIIKVVKKTGILQENGEYWDGKERRELDRAEEKDQKRDSTQKNPATPGDFFG